MTMTKGNDSQNHEKNDLNKNTASEEVANLKKRLEEIEKKTSGGLTTADLKGIAAIVAETTKALNKPIDYQRGIKASEIPKDDFNPIGVRFVAPCAGYIVSDDIRNGHRVVLPYDKPFIFFEYLTTKRSMVGKHTQTANISAYTSHSNEEIAWLREHSLYGIMFFENSTDASNADLDRYTRLGRVIKQLNGYEYYDLVRICTQYEIAPNEDAAIMKANLAFKMVEKEIEDESKRSKTSLEESFKSGLLINKVRT